MNTTKTIETLRSEFKAYRAEALKKMTREAFEKSLRGWCLEISDGEEITPRVYTDAAYWVMKQG